MGVDQEQRTTDTTTLVLAGWIGGLDETIVGVEATMDGATMVTPLDIVKLCIGWKYFDKGVRLWRVFDLGKNQDVKLNHGGSHPWVDRGSVKEVSWKFVRLRSVVDTGQTSDCDVGGGVGGHLPTLLDC